MKVPAIFILTGTMMLFASCNAAQTQKRTVSSNQEDQSFVVTSAGDTIQKVLKSDAEWKTQLDPQAYGILRQADTERAYTGAFWNNHEKGRYYCKGCNSPLFDSDTKFDSGCGWPSFFKTVNEHCITEHRDTSYGMERVEIRCAVCDGHLGHVFDDGPPPTGLRYCLNSGAMVFEKQ